MPRWARSVAATIVAASLGAMSLVAACTARPAVEVLTFSGSALGTEADVLRRQLERFSTGSGVPVEVRVTPDAADQRHQLYVQWLNARAVEPDVLQLDVVWTPEFAAAGWLLPLDAFHPPVDAFFPAAIAANRWAGRVYALPWFVDVGMLYWRRDLMPAPPASFDDLTRAAAAARRGTDVRYGLVWQGARYEGLVATFLEVLGGFGGRILAEDGSVVVDSAAGVAALVYMRDAIYSTGTVPEATLTWHEEESRFAFQNGEAVFMRNWPYAFPLLQAEGSRVRGRVSVAPMPAAAGGTPTATLGGAQLAINARTRHAAEAYALVAFLTAPAQMQERAAVVGQYPSRPALYDTPALEAALGVPPADVRRIIEAATPRPVTPVYTQLSEILQIHLHRALTRQVEPASALTAAAAEIRRLLAKSGLAPATASAGAGAGDTGAGRVEGGT